MKTAGRPPEFPPLDAPLPDAALPKASRVRLAARPRRWPIKIADAYLLRHVAEASLRGLLWFAGLLMMVTVITAVRKVVDQSLSWFGVLQLLATELPRVFVFTLPMSVLYGTVQTFADLSAKGEATALQVGGMSLGRMMRAPLWWGMFVGLCVFVLQEKIVPVTQQNKQNIIMQALIKTAPTRKNFRISDPSDGKGALKSIVQAKSLDFKTGTMLRPRIQLFNSDQRVYLEIAAERGVWDIEKGKWHLFGVERVMHSMGNANTPFITGNDGEILFDLPSPNAMGQKTMTLSQHLDNGDFELASMSDLRDHRTELQNELSTQNEEDRVKTIKLINSMTYGIHDKAATSFVCLFLVLVGAPLALRQQRAGGGYSMGISLVVLLIYYVLWTWAQALGRTGEVNPILFGYAPVLLTAAVGLVLFWKKNR